MEVLVAASSGAIAGLISGVIGSLVAPWVQWAIEKRRTRQSNRREIIKAVRDELETFEFDTGQGYFGDTAAYSAIRPYLKPHVRNHVESSIPSGYAEPGRGKSPKKHALQDDVARIEKEWGLV